MVTVKKPERFLRRLFQVAVEIIKEKSPKASFVDFHGCAGFHKPFLAQLSFFLLLLRKIEEKFRARIVYRRRSARGLIPSMVGFSHQ
ncbi:MAG: hypothetical protein DME33_08890 [Verrucomicrobia bacterium]|nr:MAG: hypothetical protein DME33_08890 [Verrucomicrobiota bacterium]